MGTGRARRFFFTGLAALLPTLLTFYLLYVVADTIHESVGTRVNQVLGRAGVPVSADSVVGDAIAFVCLLGLAWLSGFLLATYFGRALFRHIDRALRRTPVVRVVYPGLKRVTDFFLVEHAIRQGRVVAAQYPRQGVYVVGFVTGEGLRALDAGPDDAFVTVLIPSTPPLTGATVLLRRSELVPLQMSVDEAVKFLVSGGVVVPPGHRSGTAPDSPAAPGGSPGAMDSGTALSGPASEG